MEKENIQRSVIREAAQRFTPGIYPGPAKPGTGFSDRGLNGSPKLAAYTPALSNRSFSGALRGGSFRGRFQA